MFKKEYLLVFALAGLAIVYVFFSLLVFLTRGKWPRAFNKKLATGAMIVAFCAILNSQSITYSQTVEPTPAYGTAVPTNAPVYGTATPDPQDTPDPAITPTPTPVYEHPDGTVWVEPPRQMVRPDSEFQTEIRVSSIQNVAAYGMEITYDDSMIVYNSVETGKDGYIAAINDTEPGIVIIGGFDALGTGPGPDLHFLTIHWTAGSAEGTTLLDLTINTLAGSDAIAVGTPTGVGGSVIISNIVLGDVNDDTLVDIVDALLTSQYYVGLDPRDFNPAAADVDASGGVDIIDALLIAQKYVGLIDRFPGE